MIIKGTSRAGPAGLAAHLGNAEKNERIDLLETRGTVADDLRGALIEMDAYAVGTRCEKSLYHAALSPEPPHRLTPEQRMEAVNALEEKLGLTGHARVIVLHEKEGREHLHMVWSRIDLERMKSVSDSHNYRKHEEVARDLERRFGHDRIQGAHHEREGVERPDRTPSRSELRQEEKTGIKGKLVKEEVTSAFRASDSAAAFVAALEDKGYLFAQGDRRDYVILDSAGGIHSLARRIDGVKAAELREFMAPLDRDSFPTVDEAKLIQAERARAAAEARAEIGDEPARQRQAATSIAEDRLAAAYGGNQTYVAQSQAAQRDFKRRQEKLNEDRGGDDEPAAKQKAEREHLERGKAAERYQAAYAPPAPGATRSDTSARQGEITDRMARLLGRREGDQERERSDERPPGHQREAPGGGRTRSR